MNVRARGGGRKQKKRMTMKKTLILFLLALLAAPLWGQRTYGELSTDELRQLANNGDAKAQDALGIRYYEGDRAPQDYKQAVYWWTKAANQGDAEAQYNLGLCYYNGYGVAQDKKQAVHWWTKAANQGDAVAQFNLGNSYFKGEGVAKDYKQAVYWYTKAANQGDAQAQFNLGLCYYEGFGVAKDCRQALNWLKKAKAQENELNSMQQTLLASFLKLAAECAETQAPASTPQSTSTTSSSSTPKPKQGSAAELVTQAENYRYGLKGVTRNPAKAVELYRQAANMGDAEAQYQLGTCYDLGNGVAQDYKQAVHWYTKAANQGYATAQYNLGLCYDEGYGVAQDYKQAVHWYTKAANQGVAAAQHNLGLCYYNGNGVAQNKARALEWHKKAANQGYPLSQHKLANQYYRGEGTFQSYKLALHWYKKAWTRKEEFDEQERYTMEVRMKECEEKVEQARPSSSATTSSSTTNPRSPVSTSTTTPSYTYSGSSSSTGSGKYSRWPWYYDGVEYGIHFAYIQRAIHARDAVSGETGYADVFGEEGWSKGFQIGMHFNPMGKKEIIGMNSGFYMEMLFDKWKNAPSGYYDNYYEFNLHVPLEMVLYLPFGRESALHLRAGLGADFSCLAKVTDWDDSYMPSQEVDYGEGFINRFNLSLNLGVSFRFEGVMLHATYQKGLLGHPFSQGYRCTLDKLSLGLSFVVDD